VLAQRAAGANLEADALPDAEPGDEIEWARDGSTPATAPMTSSSQRLRNPVRLARTGIRSLSSRGASSTRCARGERCSTSKKKTFGDDAGDERFAINGLPATVS
jgi:hypothetical protein